MALRRACNMKKENVKVLISSNQEANEVVIRLHENSKVPAIVTKDGVLLDYSKNMYIELKGNELEEIYNAYKSLQ